MSAGIQLAQKRLSPRAKRGPLFALVARERDLRQPNSPCPLQKDLVIFPQPE
jgi:hypothetical protein